MDLLQEAIALRVITVKLALNHPHLAQSVNSSPPMVEQLLLIARIAQVDPTVTKKASRLQLLVIGTSPVTLVTTAQLAIRRVLSPTSARLETTAQPAQRPKSHVQQAPMSQELVLTSAKTARPATIAQVRVTQHQQFAQRATVQLEARQSLCALMELIVTKTQSR